MVLKVYLPVFTGGTASMGYVASSSVMRDHASVVKVDYGYRGHLRSTKGFPRNKVVHTSGYDCCRKKRKNTRKKTIEILGIRR